MAIKVSKLTDEQTAAMAPFAKEWIRKGLSIEKINHQKGITVIGKCYAAANLKAPQTVEFVASPLAMVRRGAELQGKKGDKDTERNLVGRCCWGQHDGWLSFYAFFREKCGLRDETEKAAGLFDAYDELHWWLPFENYCLASERPVVQKIEGGQLHCDNGPALLYADGFCVYRLWGVTVPEWLARTPAKDLDVKKVMELSNVDQRTVGIRKLGIDKMRDHLKVEVIDKHDDYELWTLEIEGRRVGPYLKMVGPTTGEIHVEGVGARPGQLDTSIKTCQDAVMFRRPRKEEGAKYTAPLFQA